MTSSVFADEQPVVQTYSKDDNITFGLEIKDGEKITKPVYKKILRGGFGGLRKNAYIRGEIRRHTGK